MTRLALGRGWSPRPSLFRDSPTPLACSLQRHHPTNTSASLPNWCSPVPSPALTLGITLAA